MSLMQVIQNLSYYKKQITYPNLQNGIASHLQMEYN